MHRIRLIWFELPGYIQYFMFSIEVTTRMIKFFGSFPESAPSFICDLGIEKKLINKRNDYLIFYRSTPVEINSCHAEVPNESNLFSV